MSLTEAQLKAFIIVPKVTSVLSLIGSSIILSDVVAVYRGKRGQERLTPRYRILAGMSSCDLLSSLGWFLTSWPIPSDFPYSKWNVGTQATCTFQGILIQWSIGTCFYSGSLAVYYFLVIRQGWSDERISKCAEPMMHFLCLGFTFGSVVAAIALTLYNPARWGCTIIESPIGCSQSYQKQDGGYPCARGDNAYIYAYVIYYVPIWSTFIVLTTCLFLIYIKIKRQEQATLEYRPSHSHAKAFAFQAIMYIGAFFMSWSVVTSAALFYLLTEKIFFWHVFVGVVLAPSQGFFNIIVYKLPEYQRYRRRKRRESALRQAHRLTISDTNGSSSNTALYVSYRIDPNDSNILRNVQHQCQESTDENVPDQFGDVNNEVSGHVQEEQSPATSLQAEEQQHNDSNATIEC